MFSLSVCVSVCLCVRLCLWRKFQPNGSTDLDAVFAKWLLIALAQTLLKLVTLGQRSRSQWRNINFFCNQLSMYQILLNQQTLYLVPMYNYIGSIYWLKWKWPWCQRLQVMVKSHKIWNKGYSLQTISLTDIILVPDTKVQYSKRHLMT